MTVDFLITALIVVLVTGTGVSYTLTVGMTHGATASAIGAFGCSRGIAPHLAAAMLGVAARVHHLSLAFSLCT